MAPRRPGGGRGRKGACQESEQKGPSGVHAGRVGLGFLPVTGNYLRTQKIQDMDEIIVEPQEDTQRPIHPNGSFAARCVDVIDLGMRVREFEGKKSAKHTIALVFVTGKKVPDDQGGFMHELAQEFTLSIHPRATLRKFLEAWRGKKFTNDELGDSFSLTKEAGGKEGLISIVHNPSRKDPAKIYANIDGMLPLPEGMAFKSEPFNYERAPYWKDRKDRYEAEFAAYMSEAPAPDDLPH